MFVRIASHAADTGRILFQGKPEELAANKIVREKYLSNSFVLRKKDFQTIDEEHRAREKAENERYS